MPDQAQNKSEAVQALQAAYGAASQEAFGSAAFLDRLHTGDDLAHAAQDSYRIFTGDLWERYGEDAWMGSWKEVYSRTGKHDIVAELQGLADRDAALSVPMILDIDVDALSGVFDAPAVTELRVYTLGDGEAMSGLLIAARDAELEEATFLVFLMD